MLLSDSDISRLLQGQSPIAAPIELADGSSKSQVQPSSLDLRVGAIYLPGQREGESGSTGTPRREYSLPPGHTAVVETEETLELTADIAGIAFPPDSVSKNGLLVTNPGHIDPGFQGKIKFTVINMGREAYPLTAGKRIATLLLFRLEVPAADGWFARVGKPGEGVTQEMLDVLSSDFLAVEARSERIAKKQVDDARLGTVVWSAVWSAASTAVIILLAIVPTYLGFLNRTSDLGERIARLDSQQASSVASEESLERQIAQLQQQVRKLELRQR